MQLIFVLLLILTMTPGFAQGQPTPQPPSQPEIAPRSEAQNITIEALQGATISGVVNYVGRFRTHLGEATSNIAWNYRLRVGPGSTVTMSTTRNVHWQTKDGPKTASLSKSLTGTIGVPRQATDGAALWLLEGNTLILLRVFEVGGNAMRITFTRTGSKLSCSATAPMAREVGAGSTKTQAAVGGKVEMLSTRQTSSSCHISNA
jgi:hypothetical protein